MYKSKVIAVVASFFFGAWPSYCLSSDYTICGDGVPVDKQLDFAIGDWGFNEGAVCGLTIMGNMGGIPVPNIPLSDMIAGNSYKRAEMMKAAVRGWHAGYKDQAIGISICSAVHNPAAHQCLEQHRSEVGRWLESRIPSL